MSETKHTPGPWVIRPRNNPHEWDVVKFDTSAGDDPWFIAAVFDGAEGRLSADNARLIAAAPDLLEVVSDWLDVGNSMSGRRIIRERARAAIAKATGG